MRTSDFYKQPSANILNETLSKKFGEKLDIANYSTNQLNQASSLIETKLASLKKGKFNENLRSEEFHRLKLMQDIVKTALSERAVSKSQQQAAGAALAAKRGKGKAKGASKEMMKMSTKELEKIAGTKHKGLPKKKTNESMSTMMELAQHHAEEYSKAHKSGDLEKAIHHKKQCEECGGILSHGPMGECMMGHAGIAGGKPRVIVLQPAMGGMGAPMMAAEGKKAKPDFLDIDKDGNKKEPMKKAIADKKKKKIKESILSDKVRRGNALMKEMRENMMYTSALRRFINEGEEGKAELIMAVKDMVDKMTAWSEDIAQMQAQTAMEMADAIRDELGSDLAGQFTQAVQPALDSAFQAVKGAREALNSTVGTLTGEGGSPMGAEPAGDMGGDMGAELPADDTGGDMGAELPADDAGAELPAEEPGREKRESLEKRLRLTKLLVGR
jgi:hypothetical protein